MFLDFIKGKAIKQLVQGILILQVSSKVQSTLCQLHYYMYKGKLQAKHLFGLLAFNTWKVSSCLKFCIFDFEPINDCRRKLKYKDCCPIQWETLATLSVEVIWRRD